MSSRARSTLRFTRVLAASTAALVAVVTSAGNAGAATTFTASGLQASVSGTTVTASVSASSSASVTMDHVGICVRDQQNTIYDFPLLAGKQLGPTPTTLTGTRTFPAGTYRYYACGQLNGVWGSAGEKKSFTVPGSSGDSIPAPGSGWSRVFTEDFSTDVAAGSFPGALSNRWASYDGFTNGTKNGDYNSDILSVHDGVLDANLHAENGRPQTAAPVPLINGSWTGQVYGRYSVRMKSDPVRGWSTAFLLWPDSDNWQEGEIDFPESGLQDVAKGYNHCPGHPADNCTWFVTDAKYSDWHTYTVEWMPGRINFLVDEKVVSTTTSGIPTTRMHWVMELLSPEASYAAKTPAHFQMAWVTIDKRS